MANANRTAAILCGGNQRSRIREIAGFAESLMEKGMNVQTDNELLAEALKMESLDPNDLLNGADIAVGFGGDGTILQLARHSAARGVPVFGVNFGQLGFLAESGADDLEAAAKALAVGLYRIEEKTMLRVDCANGSAFALNDIVIRRESSLAVLRAKIYVDGEHLDDYVADGLLFSTTTGSTAYALSCGGPIVDPSLDIMSFTPICSHSLRARAILMNPNQRIEARIFPRSLPAIICADGQDILHTTEEESIVITRAPYAARFICLGMGGSGFYYKVFSKLVDRTQ